MLQDDRFETVAAAVEEGRVIVDNVHKFVFYLFSCNLAEVLVLFLATLAGVRVPLLPLQILWLNLVTDTFPALALALEPGDTAVMNRPPRDPQEAFLSRGPLLRVGFYGLLITASTLGAYALALDGPEDRARTIAFMTLAFAQILHLGNARSEGAVIRPARAIANPFALGAVGSIRGAAAGRRQLRPAGGPLTACRARVLRLGTGRVGGRRSRGCRPGNQDGYRGALSNRDAVIPANSLTGSAGWRTCGRVISARVPPPSLGVRLTVPS